MIALRDCFTTLAPLVLACGILLFLAAPDALAQAGAKPPPTHKDVSYLPHESNAIDIWLADSETPTPLVLYIHGGGFRGGSKNSIDADAVTKLLAAGISVAAVEYRLIGVAKLPAAHHDCRRALQFLRSKADEWNFDKARLGAFGGSAGAQICMWLAFHDEMADPTSDDLIARESTRLTCVATNGGQTTMDFDWWMKHIPGYDKAHRDVHESFDVKNEEELRAIVADVSALSIISADDPPIHMQYGQRPTDPVPTDPAKANGWKVHHVMFGIKLKEKMDELGVEANLKHPGLETAYESREDFFIKKLTEVAQ
jgi:acetyl esterase